MGPISYKLKAKQRESVFPLLLSLFSDGPQEGGHAGDGNSAANCEPPKQVKKLQGTVVSLLLGSGFCCLSSWSS